MSDPLLGAESSDAREPGLVKGVSVGTVTQNKDPDGLGRVKIKFPWRKDSDESYWARIAVPMAGKDRGTWFLPEVGDEVLVACDGEKVEHPYVVGCLWNGKDKPPQTNSDGKNDLRVIRSREGHEIVFDDGPKGRIEIHLKDDKRTVRLDPDGIEISDDSGNSIAITSSSGKIAIKSATSISIESTTIDIKANGAMTLQANGTLTVKGTTVMIN